MQAGGLGYNRIQDTSAYCNSWYKLCFSADLDWMHRLTRIQWTAPTHAKAAQSYPRAGHSQVARVYLGRRSDGAS
jgi:hypothetical protein